MRDSDDNYSNKASEDASENASNNEPASDDATGPAPGIDSRGYWRANLKLSAVLLVIWFLVSFGFGILLVEPLNRIPFFGFKLGFWWAQQGSIYVFIALIFVYTAMMKKIDRTYDVHDDED